jgi:hypothetical protein
MGTQMKRTLMIAALALLGMAPLAHAQENSGRLYYPGSMWTTTGTLSPVERGNVLSITHVEQGISKRGAEIFAQATFRTDSQHLDWNRRVSDGIGVRLTQNLPGGMVRAGVSYLSERNFATRKNSNGFAVTVDAFFSWNQNYGR